MRGLEMEKVLDSLQEGKIISSLREQERFHRGKFFAIRGQRKHKALTGKMAKGGYSIQREEQKMRHSDKDQQVVPWTNYLKFK